MTTTTNPETYLTLADAAHAAADRAARMLADAEAAQKAAHAAWLESRAAALVAGNRKFADYANQESRRHWRKAERLAVVLVNR